MGHSLCYCNCHRDIRAGTQLQLNLCGSAFVQSVSILQCVHVAWAHPFPGLLRTVLSLQPMQPMCVSGTQGAIGWLAACSLYNSDGDGSSTKRQVKKKKHVKVELWLQVSFTQRVLSII